MARQRKQLQQPPKQIEINFDADFEDYVDDPSMKDCRHLQLKTDGVKYSGTIEVLPPAPPPGSSGPAPGPSVCPMKIRTGSEDWSKKDQGIVELRVELDVEKICAEPAWGSVEKAAAPPKKLPFRFHIGIQQEGKANLPPYVYRDAELTVNFNAIHWEWQALVKDDKGKECTDGESVMDKPIELPLDGTGLHGFMLSLDLDKRLPDGTYSPSEADFTQYLSPDHKLDDKVIKGVPQPWDDPDRRRIDTKWWMEPLPEDHPLLQQEKIETTLRVHAYPAHSIKQHRHELGPLLNPPAKAPLALREIPLILTKSHWLVRVKEPDLDLVPFHFAHEPQLKEGMPVVLEIYCLDSSGNKRFMPPGLKVEWEQRYSGAEHRPGKVIYKDKESDADGVFIVEEKGEVHLHYLPRDENLFFQSKPGLYYGDFDLYQQNADGKRGRKIRSDAHPNDEPADSFNFDWAPFIEAEGFKLPFHYSYEDSAWEGGRGNPANRPKIPTEQEVKGIKIEIEDWHEYRLLFRNGGKFVFEPSFPHPVPGGDQVNPATGHGSPKTFRLRHCKWFFRKSAELPKDGQRTAEVIPMEGAPAGDASSAPAGGSGAIDTSPARYPIDFKPGIRHSGEPKELVNKPEMPIHPNIAFALIDIDNKSKDTNTALAVLNADNDSAGSLPAVVQKYFNEACAYFGDSTQEELITNADSIISTLEAIADYLIATAKTCPDMVRAFELHKLTFDRFKDNLINAFFDVIGLRKLMVPIQKMFGIAFSARKAALDAIGPNALTRPLIDPSSVSRFASETMERATKKGGEFLQWSYTQLARGSIWMGVRRPMGRAGNVLTRAVEEASQRLASLTAKANEARRLYGEARNALNALTDSIRSVTKEVRELREKLIKLQERAAELHVPNIDDINRQIDDVSTQLGARMMTLAGHLDEAPKLNGKMIESLGEFVDSECAKRAEEFGHRVITDANSTLSSQMRVVDRAIDGRQLDDAALHQLERDCRDIDSLGLGANQVRERLNQVADNMQHNLRGPTQNQIDQLNRSMSAAIDGATGAVADLGALGAINTPRMQRAFNLGERVRQSAPQATSAVESNLAWVQGRFDTQTQSNLRRSMNLLDGTIASVFEIYKDGCKSGAISHHEALSGFFQAGQDPANVQPATNGVGWIDAIAPACQKITSALGTIVQTLVNLPSEVEQYLQKKSLDAGNWNFLAWFVFSVIKGCVDVALFVSRKIIGTIVGWIVSLIQFTCMVVYYLLGKYADVIIYFFTQPEYVPNWTQSSRLKEKARDAGDAVLTNLNLREQNLFEFKFDQELYIVQQLREKAATAGNGALSAWSAAEADLKRYAQAGYDHYYPGLKKAGYRIYVGLCAHAMDLKHLKRSTATPEDIQFIHRGQAAAVGLRQDIDRYWDAYGDVDADKQQFGTSLMSAYYKADFRSGISLRNVNWKLVDTVIDWMGWSFAWLCRGIVLLAALTCGLPLPLAASILETTDLGDCLAGFLKVLVTVLGTYPKVLVFPLDLARAQALTYDMAFGPEGSRFTASSSMDIVEQ
ncbi:hypothetical protein [Prosthecobacter sp.]|uniref:hypothetical protein n=1 Tax=Prosthecobacter sp. TaxID=1965333 RepID=UPI002AB9EA63|nr:hypothetical protein [Prosthecobacter sp.]MDZ4403184.1 hypothetical protein [Prosthecobacter sp.]